MDVTAVLIASLPKVVLHDHLDGGLRPETVLALSREDGVPVPGVDPEPSAAAPSAEGPPADEPPVAGSSAAAPPTTEASAAVPADPESEARAVADWFHAAADSGSLPAYLSTFERVLALLQTAPRLRRVAREFVEDMVADGVVYAETRWAPHLHTEGGLSLDEAVQAVQDGLDEGVAAAAADGRRIVVGQLLAYMRQLEPTDDLVEIAIARRDSGVLGLDLAGPEAGHPASWFRSQFERARDAGVHVTIHAGEADGPSSIADALDCGAERIGHGVRLIEDIEPIDGEEGDAESREEGGAPEGRLGRIAQRVLRDRICLEVCPGSNLQTGIAPDRESHPLGRLYAEGFAVAISSDNRLMSRTSTTRELALSAQTLGWSLDDVQRVVLTGLEAGFAPAEQRRALRDEVVLPVFQAVRGAGGTGDENSPEGRDASVS